MLEFETPIIEVMFIDTEDVMTESTPDLGDNELDIH